MGEQKVKTLQGDEPKAIVSVPKKAKGKHFARGRLCIHSSYNNTIVTITSETGEPLAWASAGMIGFKGSNKSTPYAAQRTMEELLKRVRDFGMEEVDVLVRGIGSGRESAIRAVGASGIKVKSILDRTPTPHGGVRPKKPRRV